MTIGYKLNSFEEGMKAEPKNQSSQSNNDNLKNELLSILNEYDNRLKTIEQKLNNKDGKGGKPEWQL